MVLYQIMTHSGMKRVKHDVLNFKFKISVLNAHENPPFIMLLVTFRFGDSSMTSYHHHQLSEEHQKLKRHTSGALLPPTIYNLTRIEIFN